MQKIKPFATILAILILLSSAMVQAAELKIGVVDFQAILETSEIGKKYESELMAERKRMETDIKQGEDELKDLKEKLDREAMVMSDQAKQDKQIEFGVKRNALIKKTNDYRQDLMKKQQEGLNVLRREVFQVAQDMGKKGGYTIIVDKGTLLYMDSAVDLTPALVKALNQSQKQ